LTVRIVNTEALPQASINITKALAKLILEGKIKLDDTGENKT
jgi:hypothetical protein